MNKVRTRFLMQRSFSQEKKYPTVQTWGWSIRQVAFTACVRNIHRVTCGLFLPFWKHLGSKQALLFEAAWPFQSYLLSFIGRPKQKPTRWYRCIDGWTQGAKCSIESEVLSQRGNQPKSKSLLRLNLVAFC
jgi:hypothetical protein